MSSGDFKSLTGPQKASILLLALGEETCGRLFAMMHEDEIREISAAMAQLGNVRSDMVERLCSDYIDGVAHAGNLVGSYENTERLLQRTLPRERAAQIMDEIRGPAGRTMWDKLGNVNEGVLANYLKNEYPQTVAVVLSKVRADHAARVLTLLPEGFALEVVMRMLRMESVQKDVLDGVERTLRAEFMSNLARSTRRDSHEIMAEIFNNLDRQSEARFITALEERNRESAERIKSLMFTFDDLARLTGPNVQILLREIEKDKLPLALKGASEKLRDLFFRNLSERAAKMLREDIAQLGPVKLRDVDDAQAAIVAQAKDLATQGAISINEPKDDEMVILMGAVRPLLLFAEDFDEPPPVEAPVLPEPAVTEILFTEEEVQEACRAAADTARSEIQNALAETHRLQVRLALTDIAAAVCKARAGAGDLVERQATTLASFLAAIVRAALPALCARHGALEGQAMLQTLRTALLPEPEVVVHLHAETAARLADDLAALREALPGDLRVVSAETMLPGDLRVAWRNGAATRDTRSLLAAIDAALEAGDLMTNEKDQGHAS